MATTLPINIPIPAEQALANYEWTDIADGTGVVEFDGFASTSSTATTYLLTRKALGTDPQSIHSGNNYGGNRTLTTNFDLSAFNSPRVIKGTFSTTFSEGLKTGSGASATMDITINVIKVSGVTTTTIGTAVAPQRTIGASVDRKYNTILTGTITQTNFKKGDILRVQVVFAASGGGGGWVCIFPFDPLNREVSVDSCTFTPATNPTYFKIQIPFKIDL